MLGEQSGLEIGEYSPRLIKQTVVGYGNAEKHQSSRNGASAPAPENSTVTARCRRRFGYCHLSFSPRRSAKSHQQCEIETQIREVKIYVCPASPLAFLCCLVCAFSIFVTRRKNARSPSAAIPLDEKSVVKPRETGSRAIVIDETLSVLRLRPSLFADSIQRMRRGRLIQILETREADGVIFLSRRRAAE